MGDSLYGEAPMGGATQAVAVSEEGAASPGQSAKQGEAPAEDHARTRKIIYFLTVCWFAPLIMWFPCYTQYVLQRRCKTMMAMGEAEGCDSAAVSASAAQWSTWCLSTCNLCGALSALALGKLADRHGRRPMLMFNAGTQIFGSLGLLLTVLFEGPLWLLLPFFFINGAGGGTPVFMALTMGMLADGARDESERAAIFGRVTGVNFVCGLIFPALGGQITQIQPDGTSIGEIFPSYDGGAFQLVYIFFFLGNLTVCACEYSLLPETLSAEAIVLAKRTPFSYWETTFGSLAILKIERIRDLFLIYCAVVLALDPMTNLEILFAYLNFPDMGPAAIGNFISGNGLFRAISVLVLYPLVLQHMKPKQGERGALVFALRLGIGILIVVTACFGLFDKDSSLFALSCLFAVEGLDALWQTAIATLFSVIGEEEGIGQGQVLSLQSFAGGAFYTISPLVFNSIWSFSVDVMPSLTFHVITACAIGGLYLTKRIDAKGEGALLDSEYVAPVIEDVQEVK